MIIDLKHNIILAEAISEGFERAVRDNLVPKLIQLFGEGTLGVQMYEDYIADDFSYLDYWYYPMTVITEGGHTTLWVKWDISDKSRFVGSPYSLLGDSLDFVIAEDVPEELKSKLLGRATYFEEGNVKLNVITTAGTAGFLSGRFSQTFIDEMTRQLTNEVSLVCGVAGIGASTIEIDMVFSPETYMEHTSEGITYRRLLMSAKGCAPRDFWIKWKKRGGGGAYSCTDNVSAADIEFSLGEDVPHKIREKEYRYLVRGNSGKYQAAMGKKNVTEWRELIKRAVKRGELTKTTSQSELEKHSGEVMDKVSEILERFNIARPEPTVTHSEREVDDIAALAKAKLEGHTAYAENTPSDITDSLDTPMSFDEIAPTQEAEDEDIDEELTEDSLAAFLRIEDELDEAEFEAYYAEKEADPEHYVLTTNKSVGEIFGGPFAEEEDEGEEELVATPDSFDIPEYTAPEVTPDPVYTNDTAVTAKTDEGTELLRRRLNDEIYKRAEAEESLSETRVLLAELQAKNAALSDELNAVNLAAASEIAKRDKKIEELQASLLLQEKEREREKALFAEAARAEREARERAEREAQDKEARERAEREARERAAMLENAERERAEIQRLERERIERELAERQSDKQSALLRAAEIRRAKEAEAIAKMQSMGIGAATPAATYNIPAAVQSTPTPVYGERPEIKPEVKPEEAAPTPITPENHPYKSLQAKLIFRNNVDPNVKKNLYEIITLGLSCFKKEHVYIKLKASIPESNVVLLDFVKFPEGEDELLRGIVNLIGNSDLGITKIIVE